MSGNESNESPRPTEPSQPDWMKHVNSMWDNQFKAGQQSDAYQQGKQAYNENKESSENPYPMNGKHYYNREEWQKGHDAAAAYDEE